LIKTGLDLENKYIEASKNMMDDFEDENIYLDALAHDSKDKTDDQKKRDEINNANRSRRRALSLNWDHIHNLDPLWTDNLFFLTITVAPDKNVDRYDYNGFREYLKQWLNKERNYYKRKGKQFEYKSVIEPHNDGAFHAHMIIYSDGLDLVPLLYKNGVQKKYDGNPVYTMPRYKLGINDVTKIRTPQAAANYLMKYMTKALSSEYRQKGEKYILSSNAWKKPITKKISLPRQETLDVINEYLKLGYTLAYDKTVKRNYTVDGEIKTYEVQFIRLMPPTNK
jgi:hypothetical protein